MYVKLFEQNLIHSKHPASVCCDHDYIDDEGLEWDQSSLSFLDRNWYDVATWTRSSVLNW